MFKRNRFAAIVAIVVAIVAANPADARPSGSFRGGFSSGRSTASRSIATPRQPSFGSFGQRQAQPPAAARNPQRDSAMSRDLDRRAAQEQAIRTYDTRNAASAAQSAPGKFGGSATAVAGGTVPPLPPLNPAMPGGSGSGASGSNGYGSSGGYAQRGAPYSGATSAAAPVIVRDSSNGWLWGIGGFMLGRAAGSHAAPAPAAPAQQAPAPSAQPADISGNTGALADAAGASDIAAAGSTSGANAAATSQPRAPGAKPAAHESSTLAKLAVALLIGGLVWLAWKAFRLMATAQEVKKHANYTFERN